VISASASSSLRPPYFIVLPASVLRRVERSPLPTSSEFNDVQHAFARQHRRVVRDCVVGLDLVAPPVTEGGCAGAVRLDLVGNLVSFEHMLQRRDLESKFVGDPQQHQDFVGPVAVRMDQAFASRTSTAVPASDPCVGAASSHPSLCEPRNPSTPPWYCFASVNASRITSSTPIRVPG